MYIILAAKREYAPPDSWGKLFDVTKAVTREAVTFLVLSTTLQLYKVSSRYISLSDI